MDATIGRQWPGSEPAGTQDPTAIADILVTEVGREDIDPGAMLDRLRASRRPYYTWALAWAQWTGVLERQPDHETARRAVAALRAVEPAANRMEISGSRGSG